MDFSISIDAKSKNDAIAALDSHESVPPSVKAFISKALDGFKEIGGNFPLIASDDPALKEVKAKGGLPINPVAIKIQANGRLDEHGEASSCAITVEKA